MVCRWVGDGVGRSKSNPRLARKYKSADRAFALPIRIVFGRGRRSVNSLFCIGFQILGLMTHFYWYPAAKLSIIGDSSKSNRLLCARGQAKRAKPKRRGRQCRQMNFLVWKNDINFWLSFRAERRRTGISFTLVKGSSVEFTERSRGSDDNWRSLPRNLIICIISKPAFNKIWA